MANTSNYGRTMPERYPNQLGAGTPRSGVAETVKDKAEGIASAIAEKAEDAWDATKHGVEQAASCIASTAENAWDDVNSFMRRYPMATLGIGFGLGLALGLALSNVPRAMQGGQYGRY